MGVWGHLPKVDDRKNAKDYIDLLEQTINCNICKTAGPDYVFQLDNATCTLAKQCSSQKFLKERVCVCGGGIVCMCNAFASTWITQEQQQVMSQSTENVQRCHIKAEFGKVKVVSCCQSLAIQCVNLNHCRLTINLYTSFSHLFIIDYCTVDLLLYKHC